jgi:hypothetical protein
MPAGAVHPGARAQAGQGLTTRTPVRLTIHLRHTHANDRKAEFDGALTTRAHGQGAGPGHISWPYQRHERASPQIYWMCGGQLSETGSKHHRAQLT